MLTITLDGNYRVSNDHLTELQTIIRRNTPSTCLVPIGDLTGQLLRIADKALRTANAYQCRFANGEEVLFIGRLPQYVTVEAVEALATA